MGKEKEIGLQYQKLVEYHLLKRGFVVNETLGDYSPYDLVIEKNGKMLRIQVRSTHWRMGGSHRGYKLQCTDGRRKNILTKDRCDFIIAVAGKEDLIYILPCELLNQKTIYLHPDKANYRTRKFGRNQNEKMRWEGFLNAWNLLE